MRHALTLLLLLPALYSAPAQGAAVFPDLTLCCLSYEQHRLPAPPEPDARTRPVLWSTQGAALLLLTWFRRRRADESTHLVWASSEASAGGQ